jgi:predicted CoA-substrate-specific enzyme activase
MKKNRITCGVDIGARSIDIVLFDGKKVVDSIVINTGAKPRERALSAYRNILQKNGVASRQLIRTISTGYGRNHFPETDEAVSEISCHAAGVAYYFPGAELVIDIGGQDSKVIRMLPGGKVVDFAMNDRCAAGTGRFIEMVADILDIRIEDVSSMSFRKIPGCEINSMCAVFAESEIVGLIQNEMPLEKLLKGVFTSVAKRVVALMGRSFSSKEIIFTGGVASIGGVAESLSEETGAKIIVPENPQITGALGAAIIALRK